MDLFELTFCPSDLHSQSQHAHEIHDLNFWRSLTHTFYAPDGVFRFIAFNPSTREQRSFGT